VANHAIGGAHKIFAVFHRIGTGEFGRSAGRIGGMIVRQRSSRAAGEAHRTGN